MGRLYKSYLYGKRVYTCANCYENSCETHLAQNTQVISKVIENSPRMNNFKIFSTFYISAQQFQRSGQKAYLFEKCENIVLGELEDRILLNGVHTVANIYCLQCKIILGWKYVCFDDIYAIILYF